MMLYKFLIVTLCSFSAIIKYISKIQQIEYALGIFNVRHGSFCCFFFSERSFCFLFRTIVRNISFFFGFAETLAILSSQNLSDHLQLHKLFNESVYAYKI